jgi:hypothetical protein
MEPQRAALAQSWQTKNAGNLAEASPSWRILGFSSVAVLWANKKRACYRESRPSRILSGRG